MAISICRRLKLQGSDGRAHARDGAAACRNRIAAGAGQRISVKVTASRVFL